MTRFFYRDPLAAAWMAKHFGMRFSHPEQPEGYGEPDLMRFWANSAPIAGHEVHPDSLHLLEGQLGDFGWDADNSFAACYPDGWFCLSPQGDAELPVRIIQRNGSAFHWPEVDHG